MKNRARANMRRSKTLICVRKYKSIMVCWLSIVLVFLQRPKNVIHRNKQLVKELTVRMHQPVHLIRPASFSYAFWSCGDETCEDDAFSSNQTNAKGN
jgi:hypothetical protein